MSTGNLCSCTNVRNRLRRQYLESSTRKLRKGSIKTYKVCINRASSQLQSNGPPKEARLRVFNLTVPIDKDPGKDQISVTETLETEVRKILKKLKIKIEPDDIQVVRKSFDARKEDKKSWRYTVDIHVQPSLLKRFKEIPGKIEFVDSDGSELKTWVGQIHNDAKIYSRKSPVIVVGSGPAGLFAALRVSSCGIPVVLLERGRPVEDRGRDIGALFVRKQVDPESNLCYGEGGAGTWSDGKLTTRIGRNDDPVRKVLETLCFFGAPEVRHELSHLRSESLDNLDDAFTNLEFDIHQEILRTGKPHLGTDRLVRILQSFRRHLSALGVEIRFSSKVTRLLVSDKNQVCGVELDDGSTIKGESCVLAVGHSAREMYDHLQGIGVSMESKPFAVGFRVEHPQDLINRIQYGDRDAKLVNQGKGPLPVADYKLATDFSSRGIYSFCMCPGGQIVPTSTREDELCINGMSFSRRNSRWANAALVSTVDNRDWDYLTEVHGSALAGVAFQREIERKAALMGGGNFMCPVQRLTDFLSEQKSAEPLPTSSYRLGVKSACLHELYSPQITAAIKMALTKFERKKPGFISDEALLHAPETRTSAPVQITRDPSSMESVSVSGLYPCGEGAGYAGGIVSAAVDGLKIGDSIVQKLQVRP
eukprot:jgi/Picsp_1/2818/NSC_01044-R1_protein